MKRFVKENHECIIQIIIPDYDGEIKMKHNSNQNLQHGIETAFINSTINSNLAYRPEFVSNDYRQGKKVSVAIERELRHCDAFYIGVAFVTEGGLASLKQVLAEVRDKGIPGKILTTSYLSFR